MGHLITPATSMSTSTVGGDALKMFCGPGSDYFAGFLVHITVIRLAMWLD